MLLPTVRTTYVIPRHVLRDTRTLLMPSARMQLEGVVVWWGRVVDGDRAKIDTVYRPRQVPRPSVWGLSVEVPRDAITEMISLLPSGMSVLTRIHTHGPPADFQVVKPMWW